MSNAASTLTRNIGACLMAAVSAYAFAIAFQGLWPAASGGYLPKFAYISIYLLIAVGFYWLARKIVINPKLARGAFLATAGIVMITTVSGNKQAILVGTAVCLLAILLPFPVPTDSQPGPEAGQRP